VNGITLPQLVESEALAGAQLGHITRKLFNGLLNPEKRVVRRARASSVEVSLKFDLETADVFLEPGQFLVNRHRETSRRSARFAIITPQRREAPRQMESTAIL
jgi:hypothetical protein